MFYNRLSYMEVEIANTRISVLIASVIRLKLLLVRVSPDFSWDVVPTYVCL